jgi:DNA-binding NarL/FixJ family response regulator
MLQIAFIGRPNKTNTIIFDSILSNFDAEIHFSSPELVFSEFPEDKLKNKSMVIVDLNTSSGRGNTPNNISLLYQIVQSIPILVLDHYEDKKFIQPLINAGASGIISTTPSERELTKAINELLSGKTFIGLN